MEHPDKEPQAATPQSSPQSEAPDGPEAQEAASPPEAGRPGISKEDLDRVLEELRPVLDDVRRALREGLAKEDGALRNAFAKASAAVKGWASKRSAQKTQGPQAQPSEAEAQEEGKESDPLRQVVDEVRDAFGNFQKVVGDVRHSLDDFIETIGSMREDASKKQPEEKPQEQQAAQPQPDEKPQEQQAAPPQPEEQPQKQQAAQPRPEEQQQEQQAEQRPGEPQTVSLFDGSEESFAYWKLVGSGTLEHQEGELRLQAGAGLGLAYFTGHRFDDLRLKLQFRPDTQGDQMGLAVRFQNPAEPVADRDDPRVLYPYDNEAYVAVHTGFEAQLGMQRPGTEPGTIEGVLLGDAPGAQLHAERAPVNIGEWNELELEARGDTYTVRLNGRETSRFTNTDSFRGKRAADGPHAGFVGILLRSGRVAFRHIEALAEGAQPAAAPAGEAPEAPSGQA